MNIFNFNMPLNEMAKTKINRTIDDAAWSCVSSAVSRNKNINDAGDVTPSGKWKNDVNELIGRYTCALIIMKKPCPHTEDDIAAIKSFQNYAYVALNLGATMDDIKNAYDINIGRKSNSDTAATMTATSNHDMIDPNDEVLNDVLNDTDDIIEDDTENDDIDPNDSFLNREIENGKKELSDEEWDEEALQNFVNKYKATSNTINCPVKRSDYDTAEDFIDGFNRYLNSITGDEIRQAEGRMAAGKTSKRYYEFGALVSVDAISTDGKKMYITTNPLYDEDKNAGEPRVIRPTSNIVFNNYNRWKINANNKFFAEVSMSYVAAKLISIFNNNGFNIKTVYADFDKEDYDFII